MDRPEDGQSGLTLSRLHDGRRHAREHELEEDGRHEAADDRRKTALPGRPLPVRAAKRAGVTATP